MWLHVGIILGVFEAANGILRGTWGPSYLKYLDTCLPL